MWTLSFEKEAKRDFKKLPRTIQERIWSFLTERVIPHADPHHSGKTLHGSLRGLWRYRIGDYRVVCRIEKTSITLLVVAVGHRSTIYEDMT